MDKAIREIILKFWNQTLTHNNKRKLRIVVHKDWKLCLGGDDKKKNTRSDNYIIIRV